MLSSFEPVCTFPCKISFADCKSLKLWHITNVLMSSSARLKAQVQWGTIQKKVITVQSYQSWQCILPPWTSSLKNPLILLFECNYESVEYIVSLIIYMPKSSTINHVFISTFSFNLLPAHSINSDNILFLSPVAVVPSEWCIHWCTSMHCSSRW